MRIDEARARLHEAADLAAARGSLLYHLDLATEVARVAFAASGVIADTLIPVVDAEGYRVLALDRAPARRPLAQIRFDATGDPVMAPPHNVPPRVPILATAGETIRASLAEAEHIHAVIVIPANDPHAPIEGYALAIDAEPHVARVAGHELLTLTDIGTRIVGRAPLSVTTGPDRYDQRGLRATVLACDDAVPNEVHTYLSLKHDVPLTVNTSGSGLTWRIDGERTTIA